MIDNTNTSLDSVRSKINEIDDQILSLLTQRSDLIHSVLEAKIKAAQDNDTPPEIFVPEREERIIDRLTSSNRSHLNNESIANIFRGIINACRNLQIQSTKHLTPIRLSVQGIVGSHSEQAAIKFCQQKALPNYDIHYATTSDNVLNELAHKKAHYGIVALNNAQGGLVNETIKALKEHQYRIVSSVILLVRHSLLTLGDTLAEDILHIYSHPQALSQCKDYLAQHWPSCDIIPWADTALAAEDLAKGNLKPHSAVIAHQRCSEHHHLNVIQDNIQDLNDNETLFLVIKAPSHG